MRREKEMRGKKRGEVKRECGCKELDVARVNDSKLSRTRALNNDNIASDYIIINLRNLNQYQTLKMQKVVHG